MKTKLPLLLLLCFSYLIAKPQTYNFSVSTESYSDLTNPISVNNGITWDDPLFLIPVGFDLKYFGETYDTIFISNFGYGSYISFEHGTPESFPVLATIGSDLVDRASDTINYDGQTGSISPISYQLEGNSGSRILKVEWKNAGFYPDLTDDNIAQDFVNLQLWFYEGSGSIEIHFGPSSITSPGLDYEGETGPFVMLAPHVDLNSYSPDPLTVWLNGTANSPSAVVSQNASFLDGTTSEGTIYHFNYSPTGIEENVAKGSVLFPNPAKNKINFAASLLQSGGISFELYNSSGQLLMAQAISTNSIDISELPSGIYFVHIFSEKEVINQRLIKD